MKESGKYWTRLREWKREWLGSLSTVATLHFYVVSVAAVAVVQAWLFSFPVVPTFFVPLSQLPVVSYYIYIKSVIRKQLKSK